MSVNQSVAIHVQELIKKRLDNLGSGGDVTVVDLNHVDNGFTLSILITKLKDVTAHFIAPPQIDNVASQGILNKLEENGHKIHATGHVMVNEMFGLTLEQGEDKSLVISEVTPMTLGNSNPVYSMDIHSMGIGGATFTMLIGHSSLFIDLISSSVKESLNEALSLDTLVGTMITVGDMMFTASDEETLNYIDVLTKRLISLTNALSQEAKYSRQFRLVKSQSEDDSGETITLDKLEYDLNGYLINMKELTDVVIKGSGGVRNPRLKLYLFSSVIAIYDTIRDLIVKLNMRVLSLYETGFNLSPVDLEDQGGALIYTILRDCDSIINSCDEVDKAIRVLR